MATGATYCATFNQSEGLAATVALDTAFGKANDNATQWFLSVLGYEAVATADELAAALTAGEDVYLTDDIALPAGITVPSGKTTTLDLAGHTITTGNYNANGNDFALCAAYGAHLIVTDSSSAQTGKIDASTLTVAIKVTNTGDTSSNGTAKLTINGGNIFGKYYAVCGNGTRDNTEITVNGGSLYGNEYAGIYHPQNGVMTINGGTIDGATYSAWVKSGSLYVNGGTFAKQLVIQNCLNGGGYEPLGTVEIKAGSFASVVSYDDDDDDECITGFIYGGTYSADPAALVANGYVATQNGSVWTVSAQ